MEALRGFLTARRHDSSDVKGVVVALSAGPDSLAMLHAAAHLAPTLGYSLRALHVHHGLHPAADAWAEQALQQAAMLSVPCRVLKVTVPRQASIEAAARQSRYEAITHAMEPGEALLLAHHQDDQAETVLLRLMRGAGLQGLKGMLPVTYWSSESGQGFAKWRPWLSLPRAVLSDWLAHARLGLAVNDALVSEPVQDPANTDARFDRTRLRLQVLPLLEARWSEAKRLLARSATQLAQQAQALNALADYWLASQPDQDRLAIPALTAWDAPTQQVIMSRWLQLNGVTALPVAYWPRVQSELFHARPDANPVLSWAGVSLRRYREGLYLVKDDDLSVTPECIWSNPREPLLLDGECWQPLELPDDHPWWACEWRIATRKGGERWRPAGRDHHVLLKHWCQEQGIPPWQRSALRCVWAGETLVMVAISPERYWLAALRKD